MGFINIELMLGFWNDLAYQSRIISSFSVEFAPDLFSKKTWTVLFLFSWSSGSPLPREAPEDKMQPKWPPRRWNQNHFFFLFPPLECTQRFFNCVSIMFGWRNCWKLFFVNFLDFYFNFKKFVFLKKSVKFELIF